MYNIYNIWGGFIFRVLMTKKTKLKKKVLGETHLANCI